MLPFFPSNTFFSGAVESKGLILLRKFKISCKEKYNLELLIRLFKTKINLISCN